jgi:hypothetical protein
MKHSLSVGLLLLISASAGWAQRATGYAFVAPGAVTCCGRSESTLHVGVGTELRVWKGLAAGLEAGALGPNRSLSDSLGVASFDGVYHFLPDRDRKLDPFVNGGYSLMFRSGHAHLGNYGGGVNYWFARHFGARVEFRDHLRTQGVAVHYWGVRFGISIH